MSVSLLIFFSTSMRSSYCVDADPFDILGAFCSCRSLVLFLRRDSGRRVLW